jgi:hypothetical protein
MLDRVNETETELGKLLAGWHRSGSPSVVVD